MLKQLLKRWADWTGDHNLTLAINRELRKRGLAVHAAATRDVRLIAVERPGWVQVRSFHVETFNSDKQPVTVLGLARDDGRKERIDVLLTESVAEFTSQRDEWSDGLIQTGRR
ncbi:MAG: hypothetical protein AAF596_07955 [Planctomycetota bacterium]